MNRISSLFKGLLGGVKNAVENGGGIQSVANLLDEYKLTEEEIMREERAYEEQLTERLKADMQSDNWFAKSVRPIGFMIWTLLVLVMIFFDGNIGTFSIKPAYLPLIETVYVSYLAFYVGSRGVEKTIRMWRER